MPQAHPLANAVDTDIYPTPPRGMEVVNLGKVKGLLFLGSLPHPLRGSPLPEGAFRGAPHFMGDAV